MRLQGLAVGQRIVEGKMEPVFVGWCDDGSVWYTDPWHTWHEVPKGPWVPKKPPLKLEK